MKRLALIAIVAIALLPVVSQAAWFKINYGPEGEDNTTLITFNRTWATNAAVYNNNNVTSIENTALSSTGTIAAADDCEDCSVETGPINFVDNKTTNVGDTLVVVDDGSANGGSDPVVDFNSVDDDNVTSLGINDENESNLQVANNNNYTEVVNRQAANDAVVASGDDCELCKTKNAGISITANRTLSVGTTSLFRTKGANISN